MKLLSFNASVKAFAMVVFGCEINTNCSQAGPEYAGGVPRSLSMLGCYTALLYKLNMVTVPFINFYTTVLKVWLHWDLLFP